MSSTINTTHLTELLTYPFREPDWKNKFLIGSLIVLAGFAVPILPFVLLYGYIMQIMRRIIVEQGEPFLPEWQDWNKLLNDGLKLFGAMLVATLPFIVPLLAGFSFFFLIFLALPIMGADGNGEEIASVLVIIGGLGAGLLFVLAMLMGVGVGLVMPVIMSHVVATDEFGAVFRWREWWPILRANLGGFAMAYLIVFVLSIALNAVVAGLYMTIILCCLLPFVMGPITMYTLLIQGVLFSQAYREAVRKLKVSVNN